MKVWGCVLPEAANLHSWRLLNDSVFGFRLQRRTGDARFILARLRAHARSTTKACFLASSTKPFDSTDLEVAKVAATSSAGPAFARRQVGQHRKSPCTCGGGMHQAAPPKKLCCLFSGHVIAVCYLHLRRSSRCGSRGATLVEGEVGGSLLTGSFDGTYIGGRQPAACK